MSARELTRVEVLSRVKAGTLEFAIGRDVAGRELSPGEASGAAVSGGRGQGIEAPERGSRVESCAARGRRERVLALVREKYSGPVDVRFGPTLAAEHLASEDGVTVHHDTLRRWMWPRGCGVAPANARPIAQRRERKAHFGELVQLDGSFHLWYEARAPRGCLMNLVDDATGRTLARLGGEETIWAAADVLRRWIEAYGVPLALYTDWKNVYVRVPNAEEQVTGAVPLTQFGRMCASLGIRYHRREFAASQGTGGAKSWDASGSPREEIATAEDRGRDGGECVPGGDVSARAQCPLRAGAGVGRGLSSAHAESWCARSGIPARGDARALQRLGDPLRHAVLSSGEAEPPGACPEHGAGEGGGHGCD